MARRVGVVLDQDGTMADYLGVIVRFPTGVVYEQQCGGTACETRSVEGYYVPVGGLRHDPAQGSLNSVELTSVFHRGNACIWGSLWESLEQAMLPLDRLGRLRGAVEAITWWSGGGSGGGVERGRLRLDEDRIREIAEAWVPVVTPDGDGVLVWANCD